METKWRIPEGKKLEETKVSERIKELHMSSDRLKLITSHLTRNERIEAEKEAEEAKISEMKAFSDEMTKDWSDSIQRQHAARQAELEAMLTKQNDTNLIKFLSVKKEQEAERNMYVNEIRYKLLQRKDFPKALGSAYLFSEVLNEREKQKEFAKTLKAQKEEVVKKEVNDMKVDVVKFNEEEAEKKKKLQEKNKAYAGELMKQVEAIQKATAQEKADKIEEELTDQERARRESNRIEEVRQKKIAESRRQIRESKANFLDTQEKEREQTRIENRNGEIMTKIMQHGRDRIEAIRKQKAKEAQEERLRKGLSAFDNTMQLKHEAEMQLIYDKGVAKFDKEEKERDEEELQKHIRLRQERIDEHNLYLQKNEADRVHQKEVKKWQMLNRFKCADQERKYKEEMQKKADDDRKNLLKEYDVEMEKKTERLAFDNTEELRAIIEKNQEDDKKYLEYAKEVKDLAVENQWNTLPIEKVIKKYKQGVMEEKSVNRCEKIKKELCANQAHSSTKPGKRTHCPRTDPTIRCKHQKERLLK